MSGVTTPLSRAAAAIKRRTSLLISRAKRAYDHPMNRTVASMRRERATSQVFMSYEKIAVEAWGAKSHAPLARLSARISFPSEYKGFGPKAAASDVLPCTASQEPWYC